MKERPILFKGEMVRAILDDRKINTRRLLTLDTDFTCEELFTKVKCPYGIVGDRLWVKETFYDDNALRASEPKPNAPDEFVYYRADGEARQQFEDLDGFAWRPSIFMPRWASRITLEITNVRVERLHDISEEDARAEGVDANPYYLADGTRDEGMSISARRNFEALWSSINGKRAPWSSNPWLWVISFRRLSDEEAKKGRAA